MDLGLSRITRLVRDHHKILPWKAVHIAGTNGKGSTARYLEALLDDSRVTVGLFSSPHLVDRTDCVRVWGKPVPKHTFYTCESLVKQRDKGAKINATSFELLTATAYEVFARCKVEVAIIECGLGGRLDATNILHPQEVLCSVITRIGLDHQELLGDTVEEIAAQKAGIIKPDVSVVIDGTNTIPVRKVLRAHAEELRSPFSFSTVSTSLDYLQSNKKLANEAYYQTLERLKSLPDQTTAHRPISDERRREIMLLVDNGLDGRFQRVIARPFTRSDKPIILDGAHNPQAAEALRVKVDALLGSSDHSPRSVTWVIAMSSSKDAETFLKTLLRPDDKVVFCEFGPVDGMPWAVPQSKEALRTIASGLVKTAKVARSPRAALKFAAKFKAQKITKSTESLEKAVNVDTETELQDSEANIVVAGSLYLVGDILRLLQEANEGGETKDVGLVKISKDTTILRFNPQDMKGTKKAKPHDMSTNLCTYCGASDHRQNRCPFRKANFKARKTRASGKFGQFVEKSSIRSRPGKLRDHHAEKGEYQAIRTDVESSPVEVPFPHVEADNENDLTRRKAVNKNNRTTISPLKKGSKDPHHSSS